MIAIARTSSGCWKVLLLALLTSVSRPPPALAAAPLEELVEHLKSKGATSVVEVGRTFLFEGQSTAHEERLANEGCVAYLALGLGEVRDVDLGLYTRAGQRVAEDLASAPYAYARLCGAAGLALYASATMYSGKGQLLLWRVEGAPREIGRLPTSVPLAVSAGGRLEELRSVGAAADELSPESTLLQDERSNLAMGYTPAGPSHALELRAGHARGQILLRAGRCYRVAVAVPLSRGVAFEIEGPRGTRWPSRTVTDERASVGLCAPLDGAYEVRVQARAMRGTALVRAFEHRAVAEAHVREFGAAGALAIAEAVHVAGQRGFELRELGNGWVEGGSSLVWPLTLEAQRCYAFAAVSELGAAAVDVRLVSSEGVLLAHNEGRRGVPLVFSCPRSSGAARLLLKARGSDLSVSLWIGLPKGAPQ